ncbi:hypothetical protein E2C01_019208 [Portunus trituberculatus]|uniref:Uncharacterized protein n=1 Tax=Portunus trituberculatus TaxID=210409 RepID=A0A5B7DYE6_PORTR|nr:hypothetical protein [Portunus trituberculatus]
MPMDSGKTTTTTTTTTTTITTTTTTTSKTSDEQNAVKENKNLATTRRSLVRPAVTENIASSHSLLLLAEEYRQKTSPLIARGASERCKRDETTKRKDRLRKCRKKRKKIREENRRDE